MRRIIFVPQYPTPMRYQEWWISEFQKKFREVATVVTLGETYFKKMKNKAATASMFAPISEAIEFETEQIREYMNMDIFSDDILFLADISFPGLFCSALYHKLVPKMFAFCHATSVNKYDYFAGVQCIKFPVETSHSRFFKKIFVGSKYHQKKLWDNTVVTRLPIPPLEIYIGMRKQFDIVSASRPSIQKVDSGLEQEVEFEFSKIIRKETKEWHNYYEFLAESKVLLITAQEETFGYQIVDAVLNGCIPIAPKRCSYPELLPKEYLYTSKRDLFRKLRKALNGELEVPEILCWQDMKDFYRNIIQIMKES